MIAGGSAKAVARTNASRLGGKHRVPPEVMSRGHSAKAGRKSQSVQVSQRPIQTIPGCLCARALTVDRRNQGTRRINIRGIPQKRPSAARISHPLTRAARTGCASTHNVTSARGPLCVKTRCERVVIGFVAPYFMVVSQQPRSPDCLFPSILTTQVQLDTK